MPSHAKGFYCTLATPAGPQRWRLAFRRMRDWGAVDWAARTIWLRPNQTTAELADTITHEVTHVAAGVGSAPAVEEIIERVAANSTAALLTMGLLTEDD